MLRTALLVFALLLTAAGAIGLLFGYPVWMLALWGGVLLIAVLFERWRYRKTQVEGRGKWEQTGEKFIDPESGEAMEVLYEPVSGERRYVRVGDEVR
jgi:membrane protein implicated in regulation of membrane protease activity